MFRPFRVFWLGAVQGVWEIQELLGIPKHHHLEVSGANWRFYKIVTYRIYFRTSLFAGLVVSDGLNTENKLFNLLGSPSQPAPAGQPMWPNLIEGGNGWTKDGCNVSTFVWGGPTPCQKQSRQSTYLLGLFCCF